MKKSLRSAKNSGVPDIPGIRNSGGFPGTERLRDRKAGQKGGTKGHFLGTEWQKDGKAGQDVWDRRAGTERLGFI